MLVVSSELEVGINSVKADPDTPDDRVPIEWAVVIVGGYNYYRDLSYNAIQRIEKIMQGRGVPYNVFQDDDISAPADNPPAGKYALQYANGSLKYQVIVLICDYDLSDSATVNQIYIDWAVGNGTNAVLFNRVAEALPELLRLTAGDIDWSYGGVLTSNIVCKTFNDGIKEYAEGSIISLGASLYFHAIIQESFGMTVWFNKTWTSNWSLGMANTTYGDGNVWYLGYSLNEFAMEYSAARYPVSWAEWGMDFWGHSINFALNNAEKIPVKIMPYKQWKGAWIIRVDTDTYYWKNGFMPPESVLQSGWVYDYQFCVLGYGRANGVGDLMLADGAPSGYGGIPSIEVMHTSVTGVLQTNFSFKTYEAVVYNSTDEGDYDRIKLDFNENMDFADDTEYRIWENMTYPTVMGKLYWCRIMPNAAQPQSINVAWWQTPMLMQDEGTNLPKWKQYGADYGLAYSFHGWQHVSLSPGGSSYVMWNGTHFLLNATYVEEKYVASRYWMKEKFEGTGYGFEEDQVVISHPFNNHPPEVDQVIDSLPWVLFQYDGAEPYVGFGKKSATSKYTLTSANDEQIDQYTRFTVFEDIVKTLYPVISTFAHGIQYNTSFSFPPYSDAIKPANPREAFDFWLNAKYMLENTYNAYYKSDKITLEFKANSTLQDYVWRFPLQLNGKQFISFSDNCSIGELKHTDSDYVYIEFSQGPGAQRLEVTYGTPTPTVTVTVSDVYPPNSGTTSPASGTYEVAENSVFSITANPSAGYIFDHWELDGVNVGSANPYSFNVTTSSHSIGAFCVLVGDVNVDGVVDIVDASLISSHWYPGPPLGPLGYDASCDINSDGVINILDGSTVSAYWTGPPKGPLAP